MKIRKGFLTAISAVCFLLPTLAHAKVDFSSTEFSSDPCDGDMLSVMNRPTASDSPCAVDSHRIILEGGYQYLKWKDNGNGSNYPAADLRFGLPAESEFSILLPTVYSQSSDPKTTGFSAATLGLKHEMMHFKDAVLSLEGLVTLPSGSAEFGSHGGGLTINGLFGYTITDTVGLSGSLGFAELSLPSADGGAYYFTFNPDLVLGWRPVSDWQLFGEVYGQTRTAPGQGSGYNADAGIQHLFTKEIEMDLSGGVRMTGELGGFERYVALGGGIMF